MRKLTAFVGAAVMSWWLIAPAASYWYYQGGCWLTGWDGFCDTVTYIDLMGGVGAGYRPMVVGG